MPRTRLCFFSVFFFFNDTATTEIYTLSLHDALPISGDALLEQRRVPPEPIHDDPQRSEEHTSELQSPCNLVCRLLLEKKKKNLHTLLESKNYAKTIGASDTNRKK